MVDNFTAKKPRILVSGVGCQYGGTEAVVSRYIGKLSDRFVFDTISYEPKKQREFTLGDNREIMIPLKREHPFERFIKLRRFFRDCSSDYCAVWHSANSFANIDSLKLAAQFNIPVRIYHFHNTRDVCSPLGKLAGSFNRSVAIDLPTVRLACSEEAGQYAFGDRPFDVLANAFHFSDFAFDEEARFSIRKELGLEGCFVIGNVGRLADQKNQIVLIKALPEILKRRPEAVLVLVGEGPLRDMLLTKAKSLGVESHLMLTGPRNDVKALLSAFDVFAFPSIFEGLGVAVVEAQANGLPCVMSEHVPSLAVVSKSAVIVPSYDADAWASNICALDRNAFEADDIRSSRFDIEAEAERLAGYFLNVG